MSKRLIFVAFWNEELNALIKHLKETNYDTEETNRMEELAKNKVTNG